MNTIAAAQVEQLKERAKALKLYGLIDQWEELTESDYEWINKLIQWEETQRHYRSLERRLSSAKLGRFNRGVAIFAKACFGDPSPSKQQKLNATTYASGGPDSSSSPRPDPTRGRNIGSK
ncbi:ATP-binding protein [Bathymodiolus platifrons methanotrophic gill symbiont]|uniref:ATP-binding protein n=1 Tax=Bathymodiolus platifrons methanotrophic gill symbiont TaxID=113268 RepID=UPI001C8D707C|nr:ATP-binding protein [Bathymodiolus platifrons methanotrophic gill symbiont]